MADRRYFYNNAAMSESINGTTRLEQSLDALLKRVRGCVEDIDSERRLPDTLVAELRAAGAFRPLIPATFGGLEMPFEDFLKVIQKLAGADASTAWCVNQAAVIALSSLWLDESAIREIWSDPDTSVANGPPFDCLMTPKGARYSLTGHWGFSSGCQHANWMMGATRFSEGGWRIGYFRPEQVEFIDNWQTAGLRGTGSFEFKCRDLELPAEYVADWGEGATVAIDLTTVPNTLLFAVSFACVALGVANSALDDVLVIAQGKLPRYARLKVRDDPDVQRFVGKAQARWRAANAYLHATVTEVLSAVRRTGAIDHAQRAQLRMAGTYTIRECAEVVDLAYKIAGSTGIYQVQDLQRRFQDMHVITQHVQARESYFALLGRYAISGEYELGPMT